MAAAGRATTEPRQGVARTLRTIALLALLLLFLWLTLDVDLLIFGGVLLGICLRRAGTRASARTGLPTGVSLALVVLAALAILGGIAWFFSQAIAGQINELSQQLPAAANGVLQAIKQWPLGRTMLQHIDSGAIMTSGHGMLGSVFGVASNLFELIASAFIVVVIGLYVGAEANLYVGGMLRLVPPAWRPRGAEILSEAADAVWYWMIGRLLSMTVLGGLAALSLWAVGVPVPLALGLVVGLLTFLPYIGAFISGVPAVLLALSQSPRLAIYVVLVFVGIHIVEGYILVPLVQRRAGQLPPGLILAMQVILGVLAGLVGLLLATPLLAVLLVLVRTIYIEDMLGDRDRARPRTVARSSAPT